MTPETPTPRTPGGPAPGDEPRPAAREAGGEPRPEPGDPGYPRGSQEAPAIETAEPAPAGTLKLKTRPIPDPPEMDGGKGVRAFWFVFALILVTALVMGAVLALNVIADPYGSVGTHFFPTVTTSDRTVKADKIEELEQPPELVVLGSSRSMRYEPEYLEEKTGLSAFNAGVNGIGGTADAWAMTQFIHDTWPEADPEYLWLLDVESFVPFEVGARTANEPRMAQYVGQASVGKGPKEFAQALWQNRSTLFSLDTAYDSARLLLYREEAKSSQSKYRKQILDDGVLKPRKWSEKEWARRWPNSIERYSNLHKNVFKELDPTAQEYFQKTLAFMNEQGKTPVVVLTPVNPKLRTILAPLGWDDRHEEVVAYVESLQDEYDFVLLDMTDPRVFDYDKQEWYDGVHMTTVNTRPAIDHILEQTGGWPPEQPPAGGE
jgi:hypothetical protein